MRSRALPRPPSSPLAQVVEITFPLELAPKIEETTQAASPREFSEGLVDDVGLGAAGSGLERRRYGRLVEIESRAHVCLRMHMIVSRRMHQGQRGRTANAASTPRSAAQRFEGMAVEEPS